MAEGLQGDLRFVPTLEVRSINSVNAPGDGIPQNQWQLPVDTRLLILYCTRISHFGWPQQIRTVDLPLLTISCFFYSHTVEIMHFPKKDELSRIDNPNSTFHKKPNFFLPSMLGIVHLPTSQGLLSNFSLFTLGPGRLTEMDHSSRLPSPPAFFGNWPPFGRCLTGRRIAAVSRGVTVGLLHPSLGDPAPIGLSLSIVLSVSGFWFPQLFRLWGENRAQLFPLPGAPLTLFHLSLFPTPSSNHPNLSVLFGLSVLLAESLTDSFIWKWKSVFYRTYLDDL